jgi:hypothetical protein
MFGGCDAVLHMVSIESGEAVRQVPLGADSQIAGSIRLAR